MALLCGILILPPRALAISPEWAAVASSFFPGVGQAAQGNYAEGALQGGLYLGLVSQGERLGIDPRYLEPTQREDPTGPDILVNRVTVQSDLYLYAAQNLGLYSAFAAYRDGRQAIVANGWGYSTPAPKETLADLAAAPFSLDYLLRPTTLVALAVPLYFALSPRTDGRYLYRPDDTLSREEIAASDFALHHMVAVGEESFFRGLLNNSLSDSLGRWGGLAVSSLLFGAVHQGTAGQASAVSATFYGAFLGYLHQENGYDIRQGVAIHFWWNFLISLGFVGERQTGQTVPVFVYYTRF